MCDNKNEVATKYVNEEEVLQGHSLVLDIRDIMKDR